MTLEPRPHVQTKIARISRGGRLRILDLFGGCGGLSLGFHAAGMQVVGNVEIEPWAAKSHAENFFRHTPPDVRELHSQARDITTIEPERLALDLGLDAPFQSSIDLIVGGPPCQAFARVGRAKLREVAEHPRAFKQDPRANLYLRFLHYVEQFEPLAIVMENVPDVVNYGGHNIPEETCEVLESRGYVARYTLLNSAFYGVPQMRERMFLVALARELEADVTFPRPTHWIELPKGYEGSRQVALKHLQLDLSETDAYYCLPPKAMPSLRRAVSAEQAIGDLPKITGHLNGTIKRGTRQLNGSTGYPDGAQLSSFAKEMRYWEGFRACAGLRDHVIRYTPRDYLLFREMLPGDQYPQAHRLALSMFETKLRDPNFNGAPIRAGSPEYRRLLKEIVPPYDPSKFPNKWRKMEPGLPARTLMAHLGKDTYSQIHYDSAQARTISVREAARLQSFPDGFRFCGTMNPAFRQIGNAVPPLLARAVARAIKRSILGARPILTSEKSRTPYSLLGERTSR